MALAELSDLSASPAAVEAGGRQVTPLLGRFARAAWPKLAAIAIAVAIWQIVVWSGWRKEYILPSPFTVFDRFYSDLGEAATWEAVATTMRRAGVGFGLALGVGVSIGLAVARSRLLRTAVGSLITGLQTMPSITWFPAAIVLFGKSENAMLFVVVLGAAPSIANGVIAGVDHIPPVLLRAGHALGARRLSSLRHVTIPAALPSLVAGLKQGWAFAWRSLMAGELLVLVAGQSSIGANLDQSRFLADYPGLYSTMLLVLIIGIFVDAVGFGTLERGIRRRRGLLV